MQALPEPPISTDIVLRGFDYMPLQGDRLFASDTWILASPEGRCAALKLWWESWKQEPAGSLPNNEKLLANLAGYGIAVSAFTKIKDEAMRGWQLCSDGRLYHYVVCELALNAWQSKRKKETVNAADRARKKRKKGSTEPDLPPEPSDHSAGKSENSAGTDPENADPSVGIPAENALKGKGMEVEVKNSVGVVVTDGVQITPPAPASQGPPPPAPDASEIAEAMSAWNALAEDVGLAKVQRMTDGRSKALRQRLRECGGIAGWHGALAKIRGSPFLLGENDRGWRADLDFVCQPKSFTKLMEGAYDRDERGRTRREGGSYIDGVRSFIEGIGG